MNARDFARDAEAVSLRKAGRSLAEIGARFGISHGRARFLVLRAAPDVAREFSQARLVTERHEQWVGLDYVTTHGLPGYPPPRVTEPDSEASNA